MSSDRPAFSSGESANGYRQINSWSDFTRAIQTSLEFQVAFAFTFLTIFDSLFWVTWRDPYGTTPLLSFRDFAEWALPSVAAALLYLYWERGKQQLVIAALITGGILPLLVDLMVYQNRADSLFALFGIWEFGDLMDFAASAGLIVFAFLRINRKV